jgi:hypothetical protein
MLPEIRAMAGARRGTPLVLGVFESALELFRFANWTLGAFVLLVPMLMEGAARQYRRGAIGQPVRMHLTVIASVLGLILFAQPSNFGSRFLLGILPSAASLAAWALSGYWNGSRKRTFSRLPIAGTWLLGFGLGVLAACAPMSHNIPPGAHVNSAGEDQGYYHRALPQAIGKAGGLVVLLVGGVVWGVERRVRGEKGDYSPHPTPHTPHPTPVAAVPVFWTAACVLSVVPLALGADFFPVRWPLELHTVAVATVALLAWRHRFDNAWLHALRYALLVAGLIVVVWQFQMDVHPVPLRAVAGLTAILPAAAIVLSVARK